MRWPVQLLIPVGFVLLALQGISELIKRIAFLHGPIPDPDARSTRMATTSRRAPPTWRAAESTSERAVLIANMAPLMFAALVVFLLLGYPGRVLARRQRPVLRLRRHRARPAAAASCCRRCRERVFGIMSNDTLLAIPFFTFMGLILERSGMAEDLLDTIGQLFGPVRGGLAYAVDLRRRAAGGDDRRGRRLGDLDGADLAADHAALRL